MIPHKSHKIKTKAEAEAGCILVAQPFRNDEIYSRSVIVLLDHDDKGSSGIVLNKPSNLLVKEALPQLKISPPLYFGGPFDCSKITYIHSNQSIPEAICLGHDLFLGGNFRYIQQMILNREFNLIKIKFFAGCVEWDSGQLESELRENRWWATEINAKEFFTTSANELWSYELLNNGHTYGLMDDIPDPCLN